MLVLTLESLSQMSFLASQWDSLMYIEQSPQKAVPAGHPISRVQMVFEHSWLCLTSLSWESINRTPCALSSTYTISTDTGRLWSGKYSIPYPSEEWGGFCPCMQFCPWGSEMSQAALWLWSKEGERFCMRFLKRESLKIHTACKRARLYHDLCTVSNSASRDDQGKHMQSVPFSKFWSSLRPVAFKLQ